MDKEKDPKKVQIAFRVGEIMIQKGWITWKQLEEALTLQAAEDVTIKRRKGGHVLNLGEILIQHGWIGWDQLTEALHIQKASNRILGEILLEKNFLSQKDLYRGLAIQAGVPFADFDKITIAPDVITLVPKRIAHDKKIMPLVKRGRELLLASSTPTTTIVAPHELFLDCDIHMVMATPEDIQRAIVQHYGA